MFDDPGVVVGSMGAFARSWLVPPRIARGLEARRFARPLPEPVAALVRPNATLQDRHRGHRAFVIGNGPSLAQQDLGPLADEITFTMNFFNRHPVLELWQPTYLCAAEPPTDKFATVLPDLVAGIAPRGYVFRAETAPLVRSIAGLDQDRVHFVAMRGNLADPPALPLDLRLDGPVPACPDTSHLALLLALATGCDPIFLLGLDQDQLSHRSWNRHFYGEVVEGSDAEPLSNESYTRRLERKLQVFRAYETLRDVAAHRGQRIFNATEGGFLDVFPQLTLTRALEDRW